MRRAAPLLLLLALCSLVRVLVGAELEWPLALVAALADGVLDAVTFVTPLVQTISAQATERFEGYLQRPSRGAF